MGKKVGIMTFHRAYNYGAALQAYSLQTILRSMGHASEFVDFKKETRSTASNAAGAKKTGLKGLRYFFKTGIAKKKLDSYFKRRNKDFELFHNEYMAIADKPCIGRGDLAACLEKYDAVIAGSDQVWNPSLNDGDFCYLLPDGNGFTRISYAASLGRGSFDGFCCNEQVREALRRFDYISVREEGSKEKLEAFVELEKPIELTVDPTLLLKSSDFNAIASKPQISEPYIFLYTVRGLERTINGADILSKRTKLPVYTLMPGSFKKSMLKLKKHIAPTDAGPLGFLSLIRDAAYVVTDSFHGSVLSVLFNKKVFIIAEEKTDGGLIMDERLSGLCDLFGIHDRVLSANSLNKVSLEAEPDWAQIERKRAEAAEKSLEFLRTALSGGEIPKQVDGGIKLCPTDFCTSCCACMNICNFGAIEPEMMADGRLIPRIDHEKCKKCGMCRKACPILNPHEENAPINCYAAQWKSEDRINSASAGIGAALTRHIIVNGGCVYGAGIDKDLTVRHYCAETVEEAQRQRKSKYVHSDIGFTYRELKEKLASGRQVMFTGTPCQIAGLRNYLGKQYDNLYCVEIICHGTPPMIYLQQHLKAIGCADADDYSFRGGEHDLMLNVWKNGINIKSKKYREDEYYYAFMRNVSLSECCYSCAFSKKERVADITLGDFWKLDRSKLKTQMTGRISLVLENTQKGAELLAGIADELLLEKRAFEEALPGNPNLQMPQKPAKSRGKFIESYKSFGNFSKAFEVSTKASFVAEGVRQTTLGKIIMRIKRILK